MTPSDRQAIASQVSADLLSKSVHRIGNLFDTNDTWGAIRRDPELFAREVTAILEFAILEALDRARPSRVHAAERAVLVAAECVVDASRNCLNRQPLGPATIACACCANRWGHEDDSLSEATAKLLDLRARAQAAECRSFHPIVAGPRGWRFRQEAKTRTTTGPETFRKHNLRCHLPRGHEGDHEATLGAFRWSP